MQIKAQLNKQDKKENVKNKVDDSIINSYFANWKFQ